MFGLVFVLGGCAVFLGTKGMRNSRFLNGTISILVGLACMVFSGAAVYKEFRDDLVDDTVVEVQALLKEVQDRYKETQTSRLHFIKQLANEYDSMAKSGIEAESIPTLVHSDAAVRARIERIMLLKRWIAMCDEQLALDSDAIESYENILFYHKNLKKVDALEFDTSTAFSAQIDLEKVLDAAKTQTVDSVPLDVTLEELASIVNDYLSR
jgi:hypothetical protein